MSLFFYQDLNIKIQLLSLSQELGLVRPPVVEMSSRGSVDMKARDKCGPTLVNLIMRHNESVPYFNNPYYDQLYSFTLHGHYHGFLHQDVIMTERTQNSNWVETGVNI